MEFQQVVRRRRMVRSFQDRPVPPELVDRVLDNAVRAPSAGFSQGWAFLVLQGDVDTERFWTATFAGGDRSTFRWQGLFRAPVIIVPLSHKQSYVDRYAESDKGVRPDDDDFWPVPYWDIDTGFAAMLMLLTAVDTGLGALFFGIFPPRLGAFREAFGVPSEYTPIGAIALGWPDPDPAHHEPSRSVSRGRRPTGQVVHRGRWQPPTTT